MVKSGKVTAIIQARMGSSRLPGKVLLPLGGKCVLWHIHNRLTISKFIDEIVVSTSTSKKDDPVHDYCQTNNILLFRGDESDVLDRFYHTAIKHESSSIVRITADCPVIDPQIVDETIEKYFNNKYDACGLAGEFPDGLDCEVFSFRALELAWNNAQLKSDREHVTPYIWKCQDLKKGEYHKFTNLGHLRWTLDEKEDYCVINNIYEHLYKGQIFFTKDILQLLSVRPDLFSANGSIVRNEGYSISLNKDRN